MQPLGDYSLFIAPEATMVTEGEREDLCSVGYDLPEYNFFDEASFFKMLALSPRIIGLISWPGVGYNTPENTKLGFCLLVSTGPYN
jgi:hypothetical protein